MKNCFTTFLTLLIFIVSSFIPISQAQTRIGSVVKLLAAQNAVNRAKITGDSEKLRVSIQFKHVLSEGDINNWESMGISFTRTDNRILHLKNIYSASIPFDIIEILEKHPEIERIESSWRPKVACILDVSNPQVQASTVWKYHNDYSPINGSGIIIADIDTGIDIYHPAFFQPDGDTLQWLDINENGSFDGGIDAVDKNDNGLFGNGEILDFWEPSIQDQLNLQLPKTKTGIYDADFDWLYNDINADGHRNYSPDDGYDIYDITFGEPLYQIEDFNGNNMLDPGEKLIALKTSKIRGILEKDGSFYRDVNLLETSGDADNHGTGACGIICGQSPGRRFIGMAPGAEILSVNRSGIDPAEYIPWATQHGADIIMYEFASWVFEFLDGSSLLEQLIDASAEEGVIQFTASGNLAGLRRKKHAYFELPVSEGRSLRINIPEINAITSVYISVLWRHPGTFLSFRMITTDGKSVNLFGKGGVSSVGDIGFFSSRDVSSRGTVKMDIQIMRDTPLSGVFTLDIVNPKAHVEPIHAYIADNKSVWMDGAQFLDYVTDEGTVTAPGTSLNSITIGAYDPRGTRNGFGFINDFSGRGKTVDGRRAVDITAPGTLVYSLISSLYPGTTLGGYMEYGGTSAALPHAAGSAALLLQLQPDLTQSEVLIILQNGALADEHTGNVPNTTWGYGKLRIFNSLMNADLIQTGIDDDTPTAFILHAPYPNPFNSTLYISVTSIYNIDNAIIDIYNLYGQKIKRIHHGHLFSGNNSFSWNGRDDLNLQVGTGLYFVALKTKNTKLYKKVMFLK